MTEVAFRACPLCGTRNRYYMLVCTKCSQSLEAVALVGTPPAGFVVAHRGRLGRLVLGLLVLAAAAAVALLLSRLLRSASIEPEAAASTVAAGEEAAARTMTAPSPTWKTLEQRLDDVGPLRVHTPTAPPATAPPAPPASVPAAPPPAVAPAPAASVPPAPALATPAPLIATPAPPLATPAPPRRRTASREAAVAEANDGGRAATPEQGPDPASLREVREAALQRAKAHLRALEQRRDELRDERDDEDSASGRRDALRAELAKVQRQIEEADRQVIRAEWALREAEQ